MARSSDALRRMVFLLPIGLIAALHYAVWVLLGDGLTQGSAASTALGAYLLLSAIAIPAGFVATRLCNPQGTHALAWIGMLAMGMFSSLFVFALIRAVLLTVLIGLELPWQNWTEASVWAVIGLALIATAVGLVIARRVPVVVEIDIPIVNLPETLHGFRIVQITDIHVGPTVRRAYLERVVHKVNALNADLIAITGDVVDGDVLSLREHVAPLEQLQAVEGVALVIGNHEMYSDARAWVQEFRRLGLRVLMNEHFIVRRGLSKMAVAGVTDHTTGRFIAEWSCDPHAAIRGEGQTSDVRLLLAHQPVTAIAGAEAGYHLTLHGHTHGGQWWPWNHFVRLQQPVTRGLHRFGNMWSYTSVGTGYWGPPKRHFRSEITLLTLRSST